MPAKPQGPLALLVQVVSLFATGWIVWLNAFSPRLHRYSWATLIGSALGYAVFAYAGSAAITLGLLLAVPRRERGDIVWGTLRTSFAAVWFAPAIILLSQRSPAALAAALVLVTSVTRLLYAKWRSLHPPEDLGPLWVPADALFGEAESPPPLLLKELAPSLAVALIIQAAATAYLMHGRLLGGALFAMSVAMLTAFSISSGASDTDRPQNLPRSILGIVLTILMAAGLTVGGLSGRVIRRGGMAGNSDSADRSGQPTGGADPLLSELKDTRPQQAAVFPDGSFPGVILQTEMQKVPMLVAPVLDMGSGLHRTAVRPLTIAFEGEYWMYRLPYRRPPPNSYFRKGTPAALSFSTTDHWPLIMEAHQRLDQPLDLRCCREVRVEVWNGDLFPGTVSLELWALDTTGSVAHSRSLGTAQVQSSPDLKKDPVMAVPETLEFPIPANLGQVTCNELEVVFRRDRTRMDKSARVAIDRFILVPK